MAAVLCQSVRSKGCKINNGQLAGEVGQITHDLELLNRDRLLDRCRIFAAQEIGPQARTLAEDRV
jgi:hypothetical protein